MYGLYGALLCLAWSAVLPYQFVTGVLRGRPLRLRERLGRAGDTSDGFWVHAVSVGEVRLALAFLVRLRARFPGVPAHLTTTTATGRALAESAAARGAGFDGVSALPFDLPGPMRTLLRRLRPRAVLVLETEIWPNLLRACAGERVPVALINGRVSPRAFRRYLPARPLLRRALRHVHLFAMQSAGDAARIEALGAEPSRVRVLGSVKYDSAPPRVAPLEVRRRLGLDAAAPLFVAGSTARGEERAAAEAFLSMRRAVPGLRMVVAPRHPERFHEAHVVLRRAGLRVARWSDGIAGAAGGAGPAPDGAAYDALLLDAVGVLPEIYAASDVAFVGGSLVPRGGHNVLEPAALGVPVLFGPHMTNFGDAAAALLAAGGGFTVRDARDLGQRAAALLLDPDARRSASERALEVVARNRGAADRTLAALAEILEPATASSGAAAAIPAARRATASGPGPRAGAPPA